jgi:AraC-like DNA-binding protein
VLSPRQLLGLLSQAQASAPDAAFVLGRLALPGHFGLASQALQQAPHLLGALQTLCRFAGRLSPLLTPRLLVQRDELFLYWTDACGVPAAQRPFLVDLHMSAVVGMAAWLSGDPQLPWRCSFNRTAPRDLSRHASYLGTRLRFDCQVDALRLPLAVALRPWPGAAALPPERVQAADPEAERRGLLAALYDHLLPQLTEAPGLDAAARQFGVSAATLKRHLAQHGSSFQGELDALRTHVACYLLREEGQGNEGVARALGFHDAANFRRSFKRWTGLSPSRLAG